MEPTRIYLKDYQAPDFEVLSTSLDFDLREDFCRVRSKLRFRRLKKTPLVLDGVDLELVWIKLDDRVLGLADYELTPERLILPETPEQFTLEIETRLRPQDNASLEGLYKSSGCFVTQCEAQGFRKITYFLDRPDVMSPYEVRLEADKASCPVLLSNGDRVSARDLPDGRHEARWRDPHKKPCYLFALVAGDLGVLRDRFTTCRGREVNLEIYAAHGKQERCHHAMRSLKAAMKWDENRFGREYDLNDYMIVAIDDFNAGAMENKGLNIFNSRLVLADAATATDEDSAAIESVVAHEYFHNWTGNRVTLRDWFHLSLKEGLTVFRDQEFSGDMTDRGVQRIKDVDSLRERQFAEDAGPNAHPVRPESCLAVDNFFTMTIYEKGAELIRMMQTLVGRKAFREGMDLYFERHDGQAVTTEDFAAAIAAPSGADFSQFELWYSQAGTPTIGIKEDFDPSTRTYSLHLSQSCAPTPGLTEKKPFHIPFRFALLDDEGRELPLKHPGVRVNSDGQPLIDLRESAASFSFTGLAKRPHLSPLRDFSAPVNLDWTPSEEELTFLMAKDTDSFTRREAGLLVGLRAWERMIEEQRAQGRTETPAGYLRAYGEILAQTNLDPALLACLIELPSSALLLNRRPALEARLWKQTRDHLIGDLVRAHRPALMETYNRWHGVDADSTSSKVFGQRALKNYALSLLSHAGDAEALELAHRQYTGARNMSDRMAALITLANTEDPRGAEALRDFHRQWREDSVVLNKWFTVQASAHRGDLLARVRALTQHPDFNLRNPNNVYSLLRVFGNNLLRFHEQGENYIFYADWILKIDAVNPQVAARLCAAFNPVAKLPEILRNEALNQIRRVLEEKTLSKNTRELLETALK